MSQGSTTGPSSGPRNAKDDVTTITSGGYGGKSNNTLEEARQRLEKEGSDVARELGDLKKQVQSLMEALQGSGRVLAQDAKTRVEEAVENNPVRSLLTALGIGFFVGVMSRR